MNVELAGGQLVVRLREIAEPYHDICGSLWHRTVVDRASLLRFLRATYIYIVASVPLMELALSHAETIDLRWYADYLRQHINEELNHDEWLLHDIGAIAQIGDEDSASGNLPDAASQLAGQAYYAVLHSTPLALLGYIYALESSPPSLEVLDQLERRCGVPRGSLRTLREHGCIDADHGRDLELVLRSGEFDKSERQAIVDTMCTTFRSIIRMYKTLQQYNQHKA